jgi:sterol desaturase/sphingolipid hydroxylase (fatty acid hydroxylase superfamily)
MHKIPFLWRFHQVHHSATVLNPLTQYRIHPVELLVNNLGNVVCISLVTGVFDFLYGGTLSFYTIAGVNVFNFLFLVFGANLRHSHIGLRYPRFIEKWVISPYQHQIHHSDNQEHFDKNMGSELAILDRVVGTLLVSEQVQKIRFGLGANKADSLKSFWGNLIAPFKKL